MPDDVHRVWSQPNSISSTISRCGVCPRRTSGVCSLIQAENLEPFLSRRSYQRRTRIRSEGEPLRHAVLFRSGVVSVARRLKDGRRQVIDFLVAGDDLGFANEAMEPMTISVLEDTEICRVPLEALLAADRSAPFLRGLIRHVESATVRVREHVVLLAKLRAEERVANFLLRYRASCQRRQTFHARLDLPMTRRDIADHLGLATETVCRTFSWMQEEQMIIQIPDGLRILDLPALARLAGQPEAWPAARRASGPQVGASLIPA